MHALRSCSSRGRQALTITNDCRTQQEVSKRETQKVRMRVLVLFFLSRTTKSTPSRYSSIYAFFSPRAGSFSPCRGRGCRPTGTLQLQSRFLPPGTAHEWGHKGTEYKNGERGGGGSTPQTYPVGGHPNVKHHTQAYSSWVRG